MATLTFFPPDGQESKFELVGELSVGREDGNDVVLPEGGLSRKHARFFEDAGQILVEDLGSSNGTFVDGERIAAPTPISDAQEILVANIKVVLTARAAKGSAPRKQDPATQKKNGSRGATGVMAKTPPKTNGLAPARGGSGGALAKRTGASGAVAKGKDAAPAESEEGPAARASLRGQTGPWSNKRFPIGKVVSVIGRVEGNDIAIEDDSVSRRHAEIRRSGGGYLLKDLESANGTFVNGERVKEAPLVPGDVIKFGVVEFTYSGPSLSALRGATAEAKEKKKRNLLAAAGGIALLSVVGLAAVKLTEPPEVKSHEATNIRTGAAADQGPDIGTLLGMCKSFSDTDGNLLDWSRAIDACQKVLTADPINVDARKLKKLSEKELSQKKIFDNAHHLFDLGEETDAMAEYLKIDSDSFYYRQARSEFRKAAPAAMKHAGDLCISEWKAYLWEKAWPDCKHMMDIGDYLGLEDSNQSKAFKRAFDEVKTHFKGKDEWVPRKEYARFLQQTTSTSELAVKRFDAIKKMYADPELAAAVNKYASDPNVGMNAIQVYIGKGGKDEATATATYRHMEQATGAHQSGYEAMLRFDLKEAAKNFRSQLEADAKAMPPNWESDLSKQTRRDISEAFAKRGKELYSEGRLPDSFEMCEGGGEFQLGNPSVLECYSDLENKAAALVADQSCAAALKATKITRKDSPTHKKADKILKDQGC